MSRNSHGFLRPLKRHSTSLFRLPAPPLNALDRLATRTILVALPAFTLGIAAGLVRLRSRGGSLDVLMELTLATWLVYGGFLALRFGRGWQGRRIAYVALFGFVLVAVLRLALPGGHFS